MKYHKEIYAVVKENTRDWIQLKPKVFYKDGLPYGLVAVKGNYIASTVTDPSLPFTRGMIRYINEINKQQDIKLVTDDKRYYYKIKDFLSKHNFEFEYRDNFMISKRQKQEV